LYLFLIKQSPVSEPPALLIEGIALGMGGLVISSLVGLSTVKVGDKIKKKRKVKSTKFKASNKVENIKQEKLSSEHKTQITDSLFDDWSEE